MKDGQNPVVLLSNLSERMRFRKSHGKGFIDDDIFSRAQSGGGERKMALIGAGDHDQIDMRMGRHFLGGTDEDAGIRCLHDLPFAGSYYTQRQTRHRLDQWSMEGSSSKAVSNYPYANRLIVSGHAFRVSCPDLSRQHRNAAPKSLGYSRGYPP